MLNTSLRLFYMQVQLLVLLQVNRTGLDLPGYVEFPPEISLLLYTCPRVIAWRGIRLCARMKGEETGEQSDAPHLRTVDGG